VLAFRGVSPKLASLRQGRALIRETLRSSAQPEGRGEGRAIALLGLQGTAGAARLQCLEWIAGSLRVVSRALAGGTQRCREPRVVLRTSTASASHPRQRARTQARNQPEAQIPGRAKRRPVQAAQEAERSDGTGRSLLAAPRSADV